MKYKSVPLIFRILLAPAVFVLFVLSAFFCMFLELIGEGELANNIMDVWERDR
jgi:hypothetical protein